MLKRHIFNELKKWAEQRPRKPLIVRGARQVGKTTLIQAFGKTYPHFISFNCDTLSDKALFERAQDIDELVSAIFFKYELPKTKMPETLLFIDEIQNSPQAVHLLRYFYEQYPDLAVIAAGSLLETLLDTEISFPVGRVSYLFLYPLTFSEYLMAKEAREALQMLDSAAPLPSYAHAALSDAFYEYTLVGGMPEIVSHYHKHRDLVAVNKLGRDLMTTYQDDVEKYAKTEHMRTVIRHCISRSPFEAARRITFQGFGSSTYSSRDVKSALQALEKAMILKLIYPTSETKPPILPNFNRSPRLQFFDTGLVNGSVGLQSAFIAKDSLNDIYQGRIAEHVVGQTLIASGFLPNETLNFWTREKKQSTAEVDFIVPYGDKLIPVEVKSGKAGRLRSLHEFMEVADHDVAVRIYSGAYAVEHQTTPSGKPYKLINLPFYFAGQVLRYL